jgi:transcriptional regulator GlxA family with amidase domain
MHFGFLLFPQTEELDLIGPWEMANVWRQIAGGPENCLIVARSMEPVVCAKGLSINPHTTYADCPKLDYLLVPGGVGTRTEANEADTVDFIRRQAAHCKAVLSVCTGSFLLHAAGLLTRKKTTTHWGSLDRLRDLGEVEIVEDRYVQNGKIWCSAGVSAGIDMTLRFIAHEAGDETAGNVQMYAEYFPDPVVYGEIAAQPGSPEYVKKHYESRRSSR